MLPRFETRHLALVCAIAEEASVTRAAPRLPVTQPALSHALAEVESRVGVPLFSRARTMVPTAAGERVLAVARRVLGDLAELDRQLSAPAPRAPIRLATGCYTCYHWLPPVLRAFERTSPGVDVRIVLEATRTPLPALHAGKIDLAVTSEDAPHRALHREALFDDEIVAVLASAHPLVARPYLRAADLEGERLLVYDAPNAHLDVWRRLLAPAKVKPREMARVPITEAIVELARAGQGVGVLARWAALPYAERGGLELRRLGRAGLSRTWWAARRSGDSNAAAIDALVGLVRARLSGPG